MTTPTTGAVAEYKMAAQAWRESLDIEPNRVLAGLILKTVDCADAALAEHAAEIERLKADNAALVSAFNDLRNASQGVTGLHLNGDVAPWAELSKGGRFEEWCMVFDDPHPGSETLKALADVRAAGVREGASK